MKSKKLINKVSVLALTGVAVLAPSASLYAKCYQTVVVKPNNCINKPVNKPSNGTSNKPVNGSNNGTVNKPENGSNNETANKPETSTQTAYENKVLELVNQERAKYGLQPLKMDESLRNVARIKSNDMATKKYFSHTSPTYGSPFEMMKKFNISYTKAAENIAQGYTSPEAVVKGWMNSEGHRANILNASYTYIGVGYEANGNYWTQLFITK